MKNKVLKGITFLVVLSFILSVCCLDSESFVPYITAGACELWLLLFAIANRRKLGGF